MRWSRANGMEKIDRRLAGCRRRVRVLLSLSVVCFLTACAGEEHVISERQEQEIREYMEEFSSLYSAEVNFGERRMTVESKEVHPEDTEPPAELTVYRDNSGADIRYQIVIYGETGKRKLNYYLCDSLMLVSEENAYYSCPVLTAGYNDILYTQVKNWLILEDGAYALKDDGRLELCEEGTLPFFPLESVSEWAKEMDDGKGAA